MSPVSVRGQFFGGQIGQVKGKGPRTSRGGISVESRGRQAPMTCRCSPKHPQDPQNESAMPSPTWPFRGSTHYGLRDSGRAMPRRPLVGGTVRCRLNRGVWRLAFQSGGKTVPIHSSHPAAPLLCLATRAGNASRSPSHRLATRRYSLQSFRPLVQYSTLSGGRAKWAQR